MVSVSRGTLFIALLFIGIGIEFMINNVSAGTFLGLGLGMIAFGTIGILNRRSKGWNTLVIVLGLFFVLDGLWMVGLIPFQLSFKYILGVFFLILGVALLMDAFR